jgi:hypothetical protein
LYIFEFIQRVGFGAFSWWVRALSFPESKGDHWLVMRASRAAFGKAIQADITGIIQQIPPVEMNVSISTCQEAAI